MKECLKCHENKSLDKFYKHPKGKLGRCSWCKQCQKEQNQERRKQEKTPEQIARAQRLIKERELEGEVSSAVYNRRSKLKRKYGITLLRFHELLEAQGRVCAVCGSPPSDPRGYRLHVDHDHKTNRVRGLLCTNCNNGIGRFQDDPALLMAAAHYLQGVLNG